MRKKISIVMIALVGTFLLGLGVYHSSASQGSPKLSTDDIRQMVTSQYPGTITEIEFETDFNKSVYEVEVVSNGKEYELKLDGSTGEVLKLKEKDIVNGANSEKEKIILEENDDDEKVSDEPDQSEQIAQENNKESSQTKNHKSSNKKTVIDSNRAIEIAKGAFAGRVTELELDEDDGRLIYEIELRTGTEKAEIEIDAYTGEILVIEIENDNSNKYKFKSQDDQTVIGAEEAITIAKNKFDGRVTELQLDKEDGRLIYEIELISGNKEAELEINAYTGEIISIEIDK